MTDPRGFARRRSCLVGALLVAALVVGFGPAPAATARSFQQISGEGSSWAYTALDAMRVNVQQFGISINYAPTGSTAGRQNFLNGTVDFAASDIPFQFHPEDGSQPEKPVAGSYAYIPIVAGGTSFMYNLKINGKRVTNLRLSGENISKIFTGVITTWNDPGIQADNPGLVMPARTIVPVVRSDGSGSTAQFTLWMINQYPGLWNDYCSKSDHAPACGSTSFYPAVPGMIAQAGDPQIAGYVSSGLGEGAIGYVNYSYALGSQFPVAKVLNKAGYYTEPTPQNVAVSLLDAQINTDANDPTVYLTQQLDGVYNGTDSRNYPLSSYSYLIVPTAIVGQFTENKGETLGAFAYYAMCQAQQQSASLGYSPMPINLVERSFEQIRKIPGVIVQNIDVTQCNNPTFSPDGSNLLADTAPKPKECDKQGTYQCPDGTAGLANVPTDISAAAILVVIAANASAGSGAATGSGAAAVGSGVAADTAPASADGTAAGTGAAAGTDAAAGGGAAAGSGAAAPTGAAAAGANPTASTVVPGATPTGPSGAATRTVGANCDPDSGICQVASEAPTAAVDGPAAVGAISPTTLDQSSRWNTSLALMLLVVALTIALVLAPAAAWRHFANKGPA